jgi:hypothetical protein
VAQRTDHMRMLMAPYCIVVLSEMIGGKLAAWKWEAFIVYDVHYIPLNPHIFRVLLASLEEHLFVLSCVCASIR